MKTPYLDLGIMTILGSLLASLSLTSVANQDEKANATSNQNSTCPAWLNQSFKQLHSSNTINLCDGYNEKPLLIVNTASHCGFTHQFSGLEALHQRYKQQGLRVVGFASDDFRQAAKSEAEAATICYENYGVTFTMMAPISVRGDKAHPLFKTIAEKSRQPGWNFTKYLVSADGKMVQHFSTRTSPDSEELQRAISALL